MRPACTYGNPDCPVCGDQPTVAQMREHEIERIVDLLRRAVAMYENQGVLANPDFREPHHPGRWVNDARDALARWDRD